MPCCTNCINIVFCSYAVITVMPALTAVTVQEPDQMVEIVISVTTFFMGTAVPFRLTYATTDVTAGGRLCVWVVISYMIESYYKSSCRSKLIVILMVLYICSSELLSVCAYTYVHVTTYLATIYTVILKGLIFVDDSLERKFMISFQKSLVSFLWNVSL